MLLLSAGFLGGVLWKSRRAEPRADRGEEVPAPPRRPSAPQRAPARSKPSAAAGPEEAIVRTGDPVRAAVPRLAIVVDDLGNDSDALSRLLKIREPFSGAVLPGLPRSSQTSRALSNAGKEVLLHLPMEPEDSRAAEGPGAVTTSMTAKALARTLAEDLSDVPEARGVNNHMGSRATADRETMDRLLAELHARGLFFLDSRTTAETVAEAEARRLEVPVISRNVFLDDVAREGEIRAQLEAAVREARSSGRAVAIGHPRRETLAVLEAEMPRLAAAGVKLVRVSELLPGAPSPRP